MKGVLPAFLASVMVLAACTSDKPSGGTRVAPTPSASSTIAAQPGLPPDVANVRGQILGAAEHGDYDMLRSVLDPEVFLSDFGFGIDDEPDPIARWAVMGEKPLRTMAALLTMRYEEENSNEGRLFRWPIYDAETKALGEISPRDRNAFRSVMTREEFRLVVPNREYGYTGPRLGILADGTWWFFILEGGP